ncbi:GNAT family N-acetyltransferase [Marinactinospora rubrisoli]|uniref:GNAT family N-acetyltransferase n=1 Tax=Marinactinospora rubrisoli TaxID=2715399 RepID=A0ABW2KNB5_9ACTN
MPRTDAPAGRPSPGPTTITDAAGRPVLRFLAGERLGRPFARDLAVFAADPVAAIQDHLAGWAVAVPTELGARLVADGAREVRHAHLMRRDLVTDPPPAAWAAPDPGPGRRVTACDRPAADLMPAWRAAFGPGHPDHRAMSDTEAVAAELGPLLAGRIMGPLLPSSALVTERAAGDVRKDGTAGRVVAAILVHEHEGRPWISLLFRDPTPAYAGLGGLLLRYTLARAAADGGTEVRLAVTEGNPARGGYDRLGFTVVESTRTVELPPHP